MEKEKFITQRFTGLNKMAVDVFQNNKKQGFWPENVKERNVPETLMLIVSELAEALEALRDANVMQKYDTDILQDIYTELVKYNEAEKSTLSDLQNEQFFRFFKKNVKNTFEDELADALIRILDLAGALNIDIENHVKFKVKFNTLRPAKHGKEF